MQVVRPLVVLIACCWGLTFCTPQIQAALRQPPRSSASVLVKVNDSVITQANLEFLYLSRAVPQKLRGSLRTRFLNDLIDRRLLLELLKQRKVKPDPRQLTAQVKTIIATIEKAGDDPKTVLAKLGYTRETLRQELAMPLMWQKYAGLQITRESTLKYWKQHRHEMDGTEVRASQIVKTLSADDGPDQARKVKAELQRIRKTIMDGKQTFAEAAKMHSEAPSAKDGGDLGFFSYRGKMPVAFSKSVFLLKKGEVSEPFRTKFGFHIITWKERRPGQLSLEDVRGIVRLRIAEQLRQELVSKLRKEATIKWND